VLWGVSTRCSRPDVADVRCDEDRDIRHGDLIVLAGFAILVLPAKTRLDTVRAVLVAMPILFLYRLRAAVVLLNRTLGVTPVAAARSPSAYDIIRTGF